jgi:multidrug resistance efflux pump
MDMLGANILGTIGLVGLVIAIGLGASLLALAARAAIERTTETAAKRLADALNPRQRELLRTIFGATPRPTGKDLEAQLTEAQGALTNAGQLLQHLQRELTDQARTRQEMLATIERDRELAKLSSAEARAVRSLVSGGERRALWVNTAVNLVAFGGGVLVCHFWSG